MQIVISHAFTRDEDAAQRYVQVSESFHPFLQAQPGFVSRTLVQDVDDPTHLINLRVFDSVSSYEAMTQIPEYKQHIDELSALVDVARYKDGYARQYTDIMTTTVPTWRSIS
ncbi:MAG: antibiotic biosynthesis monooxygenase family protein [Acidimicrobiia bacterium]